MFKQRKIKEVLELLSEKSYQITKIVERRVRHYQYEKNTEIKTENDKIIITTEINIKGVYNTLVIYPNGDSELKFDIVYTN